MAEPFTPTPEEPNVGSTVPVFNVDGKHVRNIFVPIVPRCPECEGHNGGHPIVRRRKR